MTLSHDDSTINIVLVIITIMIVVVVIIIMIVIIIVIVATWGCVVVKCSNSHNYGLWMYRIYIFLSG